MQGGFSLFSFTRVHEFRADSKQSLILTDKFDCPVAQQSCSFLATVHDCLSIYTM